MDITLTYVVRESKVHVTEPVISSYVNILSESTSKLRSDRFWYYYNNYNRTQGPSLVLRLSESVFYIHQSEEQILDSTEAIVFFILALLALNHGVHLLESLIRAVYHHTKCCRAKVKNATRKHQYRRLNELSSDLNRDNGREYGEFPDDSAADSSLDDFRRLRCDALTSSENLLI